MTNQTLTLAAAETALRNLSSTITRDDETISLQAALDALRGVAGERDEALEAADELAASMEAYERAERAAADAVDYGDFDEANDLFAKVFAEWERGQAALTTYRQKRGQDHD